MTLRPMATRGSRRGPDPRTGVHNGARDAFGVSKGQRTVFPHSLSSSAAQPNPIRHGRNKFRIRIPERFEYDFKSLRQAAAGHITVYPERGGDSDAAHGRLCSHSGASARATDQPGPPTALEYSAGGNAFRGTGWVDYGDGLQPLIRLPVRLRHRRHRWWSLEKG